MCHMCLCVVTLLLRFHQDSLYPEYIWNLIISTALWTRMLHCSLPLSTVTHDPLLFSHPRGKVVGSGKKANECFLKVPPSLISPALLSIPSTVPPQTSLFLFFSHSALQYMLRKSIAGLLRSNQKGKWEPAEARDWNKNLDKKNK